MVIVKTINPRSNTFAVFVIKAVVEKVQLKMSTLLVHSWDQHPEDRVYIVYYKYRVDIRQERIRTGD